MSQEFEKEIIVIAQLTGLTEKEVLEKITTMGQKMKDNPDKVPGIKPEAGDLLAKTVSFSSLLTERDSMRASLKAKTKEIS